MKPFRKNLAIAIDDGASVGPLRLSGRRLAAAARGEEGDRDRRLRQRLRGVEAFAHNPSPC